MLAYEPTARSAAPEFWRELSIRDTTTVAAPSLHQAILSYLTPLHTPRGVNDMTWAFDTQGIIEKSKDWGKKVCNEEKRTGDKV